MKSLALLFLLCLAFSVVSSSGEFDFLHVWTHNCDAVYNEKTVRLEDDSLVLEKKSRNALLPQSYIKFTHRGKDARKLL